MATQIATIPTDEGERFSLMQREAKLFAASPLIPQHLRAGGPEQAMANCYIALKLARTMGEDPLVVLQNIHVVNGKAGFATQYMIARANAAGIFRGRIDWRLDRSDPKNLSVTAFATLKDTGQEVSVTCDMRMAEAEGWTKNPKYRSMPDVMLRYRSAAFLIRFYAPDVMLGYQTSEESEDVAYVQGPALNARPLTGAMLIEQATGEPETDTIEPDDGTLAPDNPAAHEGRSDEQHGDQHDGTDASPAHAKADALIDSARKATTKRDVAAADAEFVKHRAALDDADAELIEEAIAEARRRVAG